MRSHVMQAYAVAAASVLLASAAQAALPTSGLVAQYKADSLSGNDLDQIELWEDSAGAHDLVPTTAVDYPAQTFDASPKYRTNVFPSGLPGVEFDYDTPLVGPADGDRMHYTGGGLSGLTSDSTIYIVYSLDTFSSLDQGLVGTYNGTGWLASIRADNAYQFYNGAGSWPGGDASNVPGTEPSNDDDDPGDNDGGGDDTPQIAGIVTTLKFTDSGLSGTIHKRTGLGLYALVDTGNMSNSYAGTGNFTVGARLNEEAYSDLVIGEILIYDHALTAQEQADVETYLERWIVPEPGSIGLLGFAGAALLARRRRCRC